TADLRRHPQAQCPGRAHCVPGGAERVSRPQARAPRLRDGQRNDNPQRHRPRSARAPGSESRLSRRRPTLAHVPAKWEPGFRQAHAQSVNEQDEDRTMHFSIPEFVSDEQSLGVFLLISVVLGGGAAWLAGRAIAATWRPWWHVAVYMAILTLAVRFLHFSL